ncbi:uncharacterized protein LOC121381247 [Gigantopelta aegis]|uniref:uncharacterized protein LOC121381247 n=1 Tax=Gigantopelta aegis TaxID=1735272 RepID=UPI001B88DB06|nr:uncharacterized protein LOC121381247 [Gigantopelta aegis]
MFPSEMDDGLEVSLDANLLNDFFQDGGNAVSSIAEDDGCFQDSAFNWADDFISSAQETEEVQSSVQSALSSVNMAPNQSKVAMDIPSQVSSTVGHHRILQQPSSTITSQQLLQNSAGIIQGIGGQQFIISPSGSIQLPQAQIGQQSLSNHVTSQQFSIPSPLVSRSLTPSQSPAPSQSPHNRSLTPNQTLINHNIIHNHTAASSPNVIQFSNNAQQSQAQVHMASAVPVQNIIQNANPNANIMQGQAVVHTQNAVIQNPNVVNVNVAHVLCNNSPQTQLQGGIQGLPVAVSNTNIHGNPVSIQGTIIQTPQGKSILIPNQQLAGQQINLQNFQQLQMQPQQVQVQSQPVQIQPHQIQVNPQHVNLGQHIMSNSGTLVQNQQGSLSLGNIIRLAAQTGQDKGTGLPPNISLINLPGGQGQQILIQRTPNPTTGQTQNIVLRTISPNIVQIQNPNQSGQVGNVSGTPMQIASNISQQIVNQNNQSIQLQQVFSGGPTQQMKLGNQQAPQQRLQAGTVTLNLAGQNINFQQMAGAMQGIQLVQQTQNSSVPSSISVTAPRPSISSNSANQLSNIVSKALLSSGISPAINSQSTLGHLDTNNSGKLLNNQPSVNKQQKNPKQVDLQVHGNSVPSLQKVQIPVSQFIATAFNSAGISTVQSTPTPATTTVSQSFVQIPSQLTVASSLPSSQTLSSVLTTSASQLAGSELKIHQVASNSNRNTPPVVSVSAMQAPIASNNEHMQRLQNEILKLSMQKKLTPEQKQCLQQMSNLQKRMAHPAPVQTVVSSAVQSSNVSAGTAQPCPVSVSTGAAKFQPQTKLTVLKDQQTRIASPMQSIAVVTGATVSNKKQIVKEEPSPRLAVPLCDKTLVKSEPVIQMCMPLAGQKMVKVEPHVVSTSSLLSDSNPVSAVLCTRQNVVIQSSSVGTNLVRMSVPQMASATGSTNVSSQQMKIIHQTPLKKVVPVTQTQVIKIHPTPVSSRTTVSGGVVRNIPPGKVPISATPTVPTQIKIANQTLTLNLTAQQKEKLLNHLAKMTQEQQEMFLEQQQSILLKLHQQHQAQAQAQARTVSQPQVQATPIEAKPQLLVVSPAGKIPTTQLDKGTGVNQIKVITQTEASGQQSSPTKGLKRPATSDGHAVSLIHQQLGKDQIHATAPDKKSPFKNNREAVRRLLRYHVFQSPGPPQKAFDKADKLFEQVSVDLLRKSDAMKAKFQLLLFDESMRQSPSAEMVMIHRMLNQDLSVLLDKEKKIVKNDPDDFEPMPLKYLKLDKEETSKIDKDIAGEDIVKCKKESDLEHNTCENKKVNPLPIDSLKVSVKSSPAHSPGSMKLVIRKNDGQGFTSTLQNEEEKLDSVSGAFSVKQEPEITAVNGINTDSCSYTKTKNKSESNNILLDHVHSPEKAFSSENVLKLDSGNSKDLLNGQHEAGSHCVNDLAPFHNLGESLDEEHVSDTGDSQRASESSQPHYSDISVTDLSGEYSTMLSPVSNQSSPRSQATTATSQPSQNFPSVFAFNTDLCSNQQSASMCGDAVNSNAANSSIKTSVTDLPSMDMENSSIISSDLSFLNRCDEMPFTTNLSSGNGGGNEVQSAVYSIMELEDVSSDSSAIAEEPVDKTSLGNVPVKQPGILNDSSVSPVQPDFSADDENEASGSNGLVNNEDSEPVNLDASFELDTNDPQNGMMNAQMQNAIESILGLNQDSEPAEDSYCNDQSNFASDLNDSQVSESMDTSQDSDCIVEDSETDFREDSLVTSSAEISENHSVEDDLDAAVQSILM